MNESIFLSVLPPNTKRYVLRGPALSAEGVAETSTRTAI